MKTMKNFFYSLTFILLVITVIKSNAQTTAWTRANTLQKGINMSAWLEAEWDIPLNRYPDTLKYTQNHFIFLKNLGFKTIRMPVIFETLADTFPPYNLHTTHITYSLVDSVISWTQSIGLNLVIDNHPSNDSSTYVLTNANYLTQLPRLCGVWKNLAQKYQSLNPSTTFFEIRNEPTDTISTVNWRVVAKAIIDTIRNYDTQHTIITGAAYWNFGDSLYNLVPFADTNIIYTFHYYEPSSFALQGEPGYPVGVTFPLAGDVDMLRQDFIEAKNWSLTNNLPIWMGETGCKNRNLADLMSRCNWATSTAFFMDSLNIPWAYWDGFRTINVLDIPYNFGFMSLTSLTPDSVDACFASAFNLITDVNEISNIDLSISIYPNPTSQPATLVFDNPIVIGSKKENRTLTLYDIQGRLVRTITDITEDKVTIEAKILTSGLYFLQLRTDKQIIATGKLIIE